LPPVGFESGGAQIAPTGHDSGDAGVPGPPEVLFRPFSKMALHRNGAVLLTNWRYDKLEFKYRSVGQSKPLSTIPGYPNWPQSITTFMPKGFDGDFGQTFAGGRKKFFGVPLSSFMDCAAASELNPVAHAIEMNNTRAAGRAEYLPSIFIKPNP
jgi:hypothetical protein